MTLRSWRGAITGYCRRFGSEAGRRIQGGRRSRSAPSDRTSAANGGAHEARAGERGVDDSARGDAASGSLVGDYVALTKPRLNFLVVATSAAGYYLGAPSALDARGDGAGGRRNGAGRRRRRGAQPGLRARHRRADAADAAAAAAGRARRTRRRAHLRPGALDRRHRAPGGARQLARRRAGARDAGRLSRRLYADEAEDAAGDARRRACRARCRR